MMLSTNTRRKATRSLSLFPPLSFPLSLSHRNLGQLLFDALLAGRLGRQRLEHARDGGDSLEELELILEELLLAGWGARRG